jgi:hypothetical protein
MGAGAFASAGAAAGAGASGPPACDVDGAGACPGAALGVDAPAGVGGTMNELKSVCADTGGGVTPGAGCHCRYGTGVCAFASVCGVS